MSRGGIVAKLIAVVVVPSSASSATVIVILPVTTLLHLVFRPGPLLGTGPVLVSRSVSVSPVSSASVFFVWRSLSVWRPF